MSKEKDEYLVKSFFFNHAFKQTLSLIYIIIYYKYINNHDTQNHSTNFVRLKNFSNINGQILKKKAIQREGFHKI